MLCLACVYYLVEMYVQQNASFKSYLQIFQACVKARAAVYRAR